MIQKCYDYISNEIKYPENIEEWFTNGNDNEFLIWAFGYKIPFFTEKTLDCWNKLHPQHPMKIEDTIFICICKINYIYYEYKKEKI